MSSEPLLTAPDAQQRRQKWRFRTGVGLILANVPFGYGGAAIATAIGVRMRHAAQGFAWSVGIYIVSWCILGLGIVLAGPEGLQYARDLRKKWSARKPVPPNA
jgi:hypothetical protein